MTPRHYQDNPRYQGSNGHPVADVVAPPVRMPTWRNASDLIAQFPEQRPHVISGLLRQGEVGTIVSGSKARKTWLMMGLAVTVTAGELWLDRYQTTAGNVLCLDNELHPEESAFRLPQIAAALGVPPDIYGHSLCVENLRGDLADIDHLDACTSGRSSTGRFA